MSYGLQLFGGDGLKTYDSNYPTLQYIGSLQGSHMPEFNMSNDPYPEKPYQIQLLSGLGVGFNSEKSVVMCAPIDNNTFFSSNGNTYLAQSMGSYAGLWATGRVSYARYLTFYVFSIHATLPAPSGFGFFVANPANASASAIDKPLFIDHVVQFNTPTTLYNAYESLLYTSVLPVTPVGATRVFWIPDYCNELQNIVSGVAYSPSNTIFNGMAQYLSAGGYLFSVCAKLINASTLNIYSSTSSSYPNGFALSATSKTYHFFSGYFYS